MRREMIVAVGRRVLQTFAAISVFCLGVGCGGRKAEFVENRALQTCNETWPVCNDVAGCLLGPTTYSEGRLPGDVKLMVRLEEPSLVRLSLLLENATGAGTETTIYWYEDGCRSREPMVIGGREFLGEAEQLGFLFRETTLTGVGDHLIRIASDATADYTLKLDVVPKRLAQ
jgi:hypothetical protein